MSFRPQGGIWKFFASLGMTERMDNLSRPYQDELLKSLTDPEAAAAYLNAAIDEGSEELLLLALRNIGEVRNLKKRERYFSVRFDTYTEPYRIAVFFENNK